MAFPTVQTADTKNGNVTANSSSWTLTYPTNLASGDLVLACVGIDEAPSVSFPAGWVVATQGDGTSQVTLAVAKKLSNGTETGNFTVTLGSTQMGGWRVFRITGWGGTLGADWTSGHAEVGFAGSAGTSSSTPNPPSLNPAGWGTEDTLWVAACATDGASTVSTYPTNYTTTSTNNPASSRDGTAMSLGFRQLNAASEDPGTFTMSGSLPWVAATVAIRPVVPAYSHSGWGIPLNSA